MVQVEKLKVAEAEKEEQKAQAAALDNHAAVLRDLVRHIDGCHTVIIEWPVTCMSISLLPTSYSSQLSLLFAGCDAEVGVGDEEAVRFARGGLGRVPRTFDQPHAGDHPYCATVSTHTVSTHTVTTHTVTTHTLPLCATQPASRGIQYCSSGVGFSGSLA